MVEYKYKHIVDINYRYDKDRTSEAIDPLTSYRDMSLSVSCTTIINVMLDQNDATQSKMPGTK